MGKGAFLQVLNLDSAGHTSTLSNVTCMYSNQEEGSVLNIFDRARYPPMSSVPPPGNHPAYIESDGRGLCALPPGRFQLNFDGGGAAGGYVGVGLSSLTPSPVTITGPTGPLRVFSTPSQSALPWEGQPGIGIVRTNSSPPSQAPLAGIPGKSWMGSLIAATKTSANPFADRPLERVSLPGAHDAGMSVASRCTSFGNRRVTQTQTENIAGQLASGVRYFDLRPAVWSVDDPNPQFYTGHFSGAANGQGCLGESLDAILDAVSAFISANTSEVVILKFSHYSDSDNKPFPVPVQQKMLALIQSKLNPLMMRAAVDEKIGLASIGSILAQGRRAVCVFDDLDLSLYAPETGILRFGNLGADPQPLAGTNLDVYDNYSNLENAVFMMTDQLAKYQLFNQKVPLGMGGLFLLSFTLTLSDLDSTPAGSLSILGLASAANSLLWQFATGMYQGPAVRPPNIVYVDAVADGTPLLAALYFNVALGNS